MRIARPARESGAVVQGPKQTAERADLVYDNESHKFPIVLTFEQFPERLDELELHIFGRATDIVVGFDSSARAFEADTLDEVGIQHPLQQPSDPPFHRGTILLFVSGGGLDFGGFRPEYVDKSVTHDLALLLGILDVELRLLFWPPSSGECRCHP
jgi:hypothetical protein